ncbi:hypothetical protein [Rhizobium leguminosarum]|uniref:hypothetical protein n=1 Tax=Rhizobium leguminosarum TaxID=384 RepID=UPI0010312A95|nr:hypothetical protein [Rhizobium leguminosarum]TBF65670.1 hypothetical protein ELG89_34510 [Rhizobium leguminosarum]
MEEVQGSKGPGLKDNGDRGCEVTEGDVRHPGRKTHGKKAKYKFHRRQIRRKRIERSIWLSFPQRLPLTSLELNALMANLGEELKQLFPELAGRL